MNTEPRKLLLKGFGLLLLILIFIFSYFKYRPIIQGPLVTKISLETWNTIDTPSTTINGNVKNVQSLLINNRNITLTENNEFTETIPLNSGRNITTITVEDIFGKQKTYTYNIYSTYENTPYHSTLSNAREQLNQTEIDILEKETTEIVNETL